MFVVKKTGLVPVTSTKRGARTGVYGVPPAVARAGVLAGELALVPVPSDIPVDIVPDPVPATESAPPPPPSDGPVVIPADWEKRHKVSWIKIASDITKAPIVLTDEQKKADVKVSDLAKVIIEEELKRRAPKTGDAEE